jgi:hypothetical protein
MFFVNKQDNKKVSEQILEVQRQYNTNIMINSIRECKEKLDNILNVKMNAKNYIDAYNNYDIYKYIIINEKTIKEYKFKTKEEQIEFFQEREPDFKTMLNTLYEINENMLAEIINHNEILNISQYLYNLKSYLNNLMILNLKYAKLSHNYLTTTMNLFEYHEIVNILVGTKLLSEEDDIVDYFKTFKNENLTINPKYDLLDFDEFYEAIYYTLLKKNDSFNKEFKNDIGNCTRKMEVENINDILHIKIGFRKCEVNLNELFFDE